MIRLDDNPPAVHKVVKSFTTKHDGHRVLFYLRIALLRVCERPRSIRYRLPRAVVALHQRRTDPVLRRIT